MIKTETLEIDGKTFIHAYSDSGYKIHGGSPESDYDEAIDPAELGRTYTETNTPVDASETEAEEIINIILGGEGE